MAKIEIAEELVKNHKDSEVIDHLYSIMTGIIRNYNTALQAKSPEVLYGNLGDLAMVTEILKKMKERNTTNLQTAK